MLDGMHLYNKLKLFIFTKLIYNKFKLLNINYNYSIVI